MEILLNGSPYPIEQNCTIESMLAKLDLQGKFAIEVNRNIIPRCEYQKTHLQTGDKIEIVQAIGGG